MESFCVKLKNYILENGYTVYRISKLTGVERTGLQRCLSGQRLLHKESLYMIMDFLHLDFQEQTDLLNSYMLEQLGKQRYHQWEHIQHIIESLSQLFNPAPVSVILKKNVCLLEHLDAFTLLHGRHAIIQTVQALIECGIYETKHPEINFFLPADKDFLSSIYPPPPVLASKPVFNHLIQLTKNSNKAVISNKNYNLSLLDMLLPFSLSKCVDYNIYYNYTDNTPLFFNNVVFPYYIILNDTSVILISENMQSASICQITELIQYYKHTFLSYLEKAQKLITTYAGITPLLTHFIEMENYDQKLFFLEYQPCFFTFANPEMIDRYVYPSLENRETFLDIAHNRLNQLQSASCSFSVFSHKGLRFFAETGIMTDIPPDIAMPILPEDRLIMLKRLRRTFEQEGHTFRIIDPNYFQFPDFISISVSSDFGIDFYIFNQENKSQYLHISEATLSNAFADFISRIADTLLVYSKEKTLEIIDDCINLLSSCKTI